MKRFKFAVGDRVELTVEYEGWMPGACGTVSYVNATSSAWPYSVLFDTANSGGRKELTYIGENELKLIGDTTFKIDEVITVSLEKVYARLAVLIEKVDMLSDHLGV